MADLNPIGDSNNGREWRRQINEFNREARESKIGANTNGRKAQGELNWDLTSSYVAQPLMSEPHVSPRFRLRQEINEINTKARDSKIRDTANKGDNQFTGVYDDSVMGGENIVQQLLSDKHRIDAGKVRKDINEFNRQARESKIKADEPNRPFAVNPLAADDFQDRDFDGDVVNGPSYESLRYCRLDNTSKEINHVPFQETHVTNTDINCQAALSGHEFLKNLLKRQAERVDTEHSNASFSEYVDKVKNLSREDYKPTGYFIGGYKVPTEFVTSTEMQQLRSKATTELANMRPIERRVHIHNYESYYKQLGMDMSYADKAWSGMTPETLFKDECIVPIEQQNNKIKLRLNSIENSGLPNFGDFNSNENAGYGPDNTPCD